MNSKEDTMPTGTKESVIYLREKDPYITASEMSRVIGRSRERVRQVLKEMGLPTSFERRILTRICTQCGCEWVVGNKGKTLFCSSKCYSDSRKVLVVCDSCGSYFKRSRALYEWCKDKRKYKHAFCNRKCLWVWFGKHYGSPRLASYRKKLETK